MSAGNEGLPILDSVLLGLGSDPLTPRSARPCWRIVIQCNKDDRRVAAVGSLWAEASDQSSNSLIPPPSIASSRFNLKSGRRIEVALSVVGALLPTTRPLTELD